MADVDAKSIQMSVEKFKSAIIRIRDILRGPGLSITGMESMRHICLYILARYINRARAISFDIPERFCWEEILETIKTKDGGLQLALDRIYHSDEECLVNHFDRLFGTNKFSFDIKHLEKNKQILQILNDVDIETVDYHMDILGWVYEQHLGTGSSSASRDLGQYFTDRFICDYMVKLCQPKIREDGSPETVVDPTMGTGGFLTSFVKYYKKNYPEVDFSKHADKIYGFDTDPRVSGVAQINLFMELHGNRAINLENKDSLYGGLPEAQYDIILANMPFGLKGIKYDDCCEAVKQIGIKGTKSEPLFLQLMMANLAEGGRCAVVVPDGVLVNAAKFYKDTRRALLQCFDLKKVIKMRGKYFMNTSIEPSILYFENTPYATSQVEFVEVIRDDVVNIVENVIYTLDIADINKDFSLDYKKYKKTESINNIKYEVVKLSDVGKIETGTFIQKSESSHSGYPIYGGGGVGDYYSPTHNRSNRMVIARTGVSQNCVRWVNGEFFLRDSGWTVKCNDKILEKYLYYYLSFKQNQIYEMAAGSAQKGINQPTMYEFNIVLPPLAVQKDIVDTLDKIFDVGGSDIMELVKLTDRSMEIIFNDVTGSNISSIMDIIQIITKTNQIMSDIKSQMRAIMKSINFRKFDKHKIIDVMQVLGGKGNTDRSKERTDDKNVPYYDSNGVIGYVSDYLYEGEYTVTARNLSIGAVHYTTSRYYPSDHTINFTSKNIEKLSNKYFYYWLLLNNDLLINLSTGIKPGIRKTEVELIEIPVPPIDFQNDLVNKLDRLQSQIDSLGLLQKQSEENAKFILDSYLN